MVIRIFNDDGSLHSAHRFGTDETVTALLRNFAQRAIRNDLFDEIYTNDLPLRNYGRAPHLFESIVSASEGRPAETLQQFISRHN